MDVVISAWIISVVIRTCFSLTEATNNCGMLKIREPAFKNKDVAIYFQLSTRYSLDNVAYYSWYFKGSGRLSYYEAISSSLNEHSFSQLNGTFLIVIKQADNDDQGSYFVYLSDKHRYDICESSAVTLELQDIGSCGAVITYGSANVIKGGTLSVTFIPATSANYTWMFRPNKSTMSTGVKIDRSLIEELDGNFNNERILKIHNITDSHTGAYFVACQGNGNTNETWIIVIEPPKEVHFTSPNKSFFGCKECLYAEYYKKLEVECSFTDGSEEENVVIQLDAFDGRNNVERANRLSSGRYAAAFSYLREYNHLANVTCQVSAPTLPQPLTVTSKLYVLRKPDTPILTVGFLREGQSSNISCQSDNSRPPPELFFQLGEQKIDVNQTNKSNNPGTSKYRSAASIHSVERSWNNKKVTCCLRHETLDSLLCSEAMTLHYEFPPSAVHISFTNISTTTKQDITINVTCVVVNANPVCGAIISVNDVEISNVNVSHKQDDGGGMTTVVIASLNVVPEDDGKRVICTANCSMFATNQTDSFALDLRDGVTGTHNHNRKSQMTVWIIPSVAAVIVLVAIGMIALVCLHRKNVARQEAKPTAERCANQVDTDGSHNRQVIEDVEYYNVVSNENIIERAQQQDAETDHVTYAAVIPKEKRAKQTGPANGQTEDCDTNTDMHSSDQAQTKETELHYADLDLDTLANSADQRKISNVEYSAIDFELSAATRAEEIPKVDDTDQNGSTENIYMNE